MTKGRIDKIDWDVLALNPGAIYDRDALITFQTVKYAKYGYGEVECIGRLKNIYKMMRFINTFCWMLAQGEEFSPYSVHSICDLNKEEIYRFQVFYCYRKGDSRKVEPYIMLFPDFEKDLFGI